MFFNVLGVEGTFILFICVISLLILFISMVKGKIDEKRLQAICDYCSKNGFQFYEERTKIPINSKALSVMSERGKTNIWGAEICGKSNGFDFYIFEHYYSIGHGKCKDQTTDTICILTKFEIDLPQFYVRDEHFFSDDLNKLFGGQDINFEDDPVFSNKFILQGKSEPSIRRFFNRKIRDVFVNNHINGYVYEGFRDCFAVVKKEKMDVDGIVNLLADAIKIFKQFEPPKVDF